MLGSEQNLRVQQQITNTGVAKWHFTLELATDKLLSKCSATISLNGTLA